jgi:uncharacterized protein YecA (UPF0149 family)
MDTEGNLYWADMKEAAEKNLIPLTEDDYKSLVPMTKNKRKNHMRNKPCVCGSGKKFKKCCWSAYE